MTMCDLAHSHEFHTHQIERQRAVEDGELRRCLACGAEGFAGDPECPRGGTACHVITLARPS